jgi:hypothetical protein
MLNLNQNFTSLKSDFVQALKLIASYLKSTDGIGASVIVSREGAQFIQKVGINTSNLN